MDNELKYELMEYIEKLKAIYKEHLKEVVLYGKCAKAKYYKEDMDIDIMILVDLEDESIKEYQNVLTEATYEMFLESVMYITPMVLNVYHFLDWKDSNKFYKRIDLDGVRLYKDDTSIVEKLSENIGDRKIRIATYRFEITDDINKNYENMWNALLMARYEEVDLIVFPECALTGYPGIDFDSSEDVDFETVEYCLSNLEKIAREANTHILVGSVTKHKDKIYNSAILLTTDRKRIYYNKRALLLDDKDNFTKGDEAGIFAINGVKIVIRIGEEIYFPEYFRDLYKKNIDLGIVLFNDDRQCENIKKDNLLKSNISTRASENVCYVLIANSVGSYKSEYAALYNKSGEKVIDDSKKIDSLYVYEINNFENDMWHKEIIQSIEETLE